MNIYAEKITRFFELLNRNNVRFIIVGGVAVNYYGYSRSTGDIDVWLEDTEENRKKLIAALNEFGVKGAEALLNYPLLAGYAEILLEAGIYIDLMADLVVLKQKDFKECFDIAHTLKTGELEIKILHINKLIAEKEKSTREKDREDVIQLKKLMQSGSAK